MDAFFETIRDVDEDILCFTTSSNNVEPHFHSNIELVYVLDGEIDIPINGTPHHLKKDDFMAIEPYCIHAYSSPTPSLLGIIICPCSYFKEIIDPSRRFALRKCVYPRGKLTPEIKRCYEKAEESLKQNMRLVACGYIWTMLSYLAETYGRVEYPSAPNSSLFVSMLQYLQEHYCEKLTLDDLAVKFGYNKYYISKIFNRYMDLNFNEFVNSMRCHHAVKLLANHEIGMKQIAEDSGFASQRSFHRAFQNVFGCTPSEYRSRFSSKADHNE